ncbi:ATP-dependent DNA helicase RecG [candidate division LCP-89 bacterium B3_LCP]|uniref:ATP-dependent DNA helicase RecG n=1 Tax=candidate division LCP-89 bacterium B3_LCP TaxID=2012998 RepID=A0A532V500_UNCL8|nr:MAG: ATP-dependent DNA helicase RecG [candidate division LCP-89 bacterium B3_LCP]
MDSPEKTERKHPYGSLDTEVQFVPGVGPGRARQLARIGIETLRDLLYYLPRRYLDRSLIVPINSLDLSNREVTVVGKVAAFKTIGGGAHRQRLEVRIVDDTGSLRAVWFRGLNYWRGAFQVGQAVAFSGKAKLHRDYLQMAHPAVDFLDEDEDLGLRAKTGTIISLYPSTDVLARVGLDSLGFRRVIAAGVKLSKGMVPEILPPNLRTKHKLLIRERALHQVHFPKKMPEKDAALKRLKYEELFAIQITLALRQIRRKHRQKGIQFPHPGALTRNALKQFPFEMTQGQLSVLTDVRQDMESEHPMNRLLQGDVGAGKTAVAMTALTMAVEGGYQGAFMAPTEVLAEQHYRTLKPFFEKLGICTLLLIGGLPAGKRREKLTAINNGEAQIVIGTHALIQEGVDFHKLGLVIIDEQHRFGVAQRLELRRKGKTPDVLVLTATPIPRSLALTLYGDLDVSLLKERPGHRQPIVTRLYSGRKRDEFFSKLREELLKGRQGFVVYPLVEKSEKLDLQAAVDAYEELKSGIMKDFRLELLHGRLPTEEKERVMTAFARGDVDLLISTTVIEVGIDVPNATVMAVMGAQRFGLSQLHQLRGRVGRGQHRGVCVLVVDPPVTKEAKARLSVLEQTEDGFIIAEEDLRIRGGGEFFGTRQHGAPDFKIADPIDDRELLEVARKDAFDLVSKDPDLRQFEPLRLHFEKAYGPRMELMDVG